MTATSTSTTATIRDEIGLRTRVGPVVCVIHSRHAVGTDISGLLRNHYRVATMRASRGVIDEVCALQPAGVVIDATVGDFDAIRLSRDVGEATGVPMIVVTAAGGDDAEIIELLDAGAADAVPVDADPELLHARLRAALRSTPPTRRPGRLTVGDVVIDLAAHVVYIDERAAECPPLLFSLLVTLASSPNTVATSESLLARVWRVEPDSVDTRRVRVAASLLRRILGKGPRRPRLETVARIGYRLGVD